MKINLNDWRLDRQSQIEGDFEGFKNEMSFKLIDGTFWYQDESKSLYHYAHYPEVKIYEKGGYTILWVDKLNDYVSVKQTTGIESQIINDFEGWKGDAVFELQNGQTWKQDQYLTKFIYAFKPKITIVAIGNQHIMKVKGDFVKVRQVK